MDTMDRAVAQINGAMKLESEFSQLKDENRSLLAEKVVDQKVVIDLQIKQIIKNDQKISAMQQTVQSEVRSYALVMQKTCASALSPKAIQTAVNKATVADVGDRNLIFHGMKEEEGKAFRRKWELFSTNFRRNRCSRHQAEWGLQGLVKYALLRSHWLVKIHPFSNSGEVKGSGRTDGEAKASQRAEEDA